MVSNQSPQPLQREIDATRRRTLARLAKDYNPTATRLLQAWNVALPKIQSAIISASKTDNRLNGISTMQMGELIQDIVIQLDPLQTAILAERGRLVESGAKIGYESGLSSLNAGNMGVRFSNVALDQIVAGVDLVAGSPEFNAKFGAFSEWHAANIGEQIQTAVSLGRSPRETAVIIANSGMPLKDALRVTRTTQVYAQRQGTRSLYERSGVSQWIWSANIGNPRTCMACIAMHGTVHPVTEVLNDHHNGRCAMIPVTPTWEALGFDSGGEPRYETGVDWFNRQDMATQEQVMGKGLFEAFQRGEFDFSPDTVVGEYQNDIFGTMRRRKTNGEILS